MNPSTASEADLIAAAHRGSREVRAELFGRHWEAVWRHARALSGTPEAADDLTQDVFERAFRALGDFESRSGVRTWLLRIATNRAIDLSRRSRPQEPLPDDLVSEIQAAAPEPELRKAVEELAPERRAIVALVYWLDLSLTEAADALGVPVGTAKSRLGRALEELRERLGVTDAR